ncbi:AraC family transcriptional regulator [Natronospora cellulosivora (SeqCode)]
MLEIINEVNNHTNTDLNMYTCGIENCQPGHFWGPGVRDHYLIHYIIKGKGRFIVNNQSYQLARQQGFLICPKTISYYQADDKSPWLYMWVGFNGLMAKKYLKQAGLDNENLIFSYNGDKLNKILKKMISIREINASNEMKLTGYLYQFFAHLIDNANINYNKRNKKEHKERYIKISLDYISKNYSHKISIEEISNYIGLDRTYLYTIFKEKLGVSPQEYLITFRIKKACQLMKNTKLTLGDISRSIGYQDPLYFSKLFKKETGLAPSKYRKNIVNEK